jgi:hypothetical protein
VYQQQEQEQEQEQQEQQEQQDAENPFLDPPFSRIKIRLSQHCFFGIFETVDHIFIITYTCEQMLH